MRKSILSVAIACTLSVLSIAQQTTNKGQLIAPQVLMDKNVPEMNLPAPDMSQIQAEDQLNDRNGMLYRIGVAIFTNITPENSGLWKTLPNGDRQWQLRVKSNGAEALSFLFEKFSVFDDTYLTIKDINGVDRHKPMTKNDVLDHFQQNAALCFGDDLILTLTEPVGSRQSEIFINRVIYNYRSTGNPMVQKIGESDNCEVNVNCSPVGDTWQDEKRGVARIYVVTSNGAGWCSGSLVNNVAQDCKPLFLTALHCGVNSSGTLLSASNFNQWVFFFRYESPNCTNPTTAGTLDDHFITGSVVLAHSNDGGGDSGSDFLLVQLGTLANQATTITTLKSANFNAYWNGWDANNTATNAGASIHHPAGDIKKISTFSTNLVPSAWNGNGLQSHWRVVWSSNSNGWGVTEGGSSGSPIFKTNGGNSVIIGTLTGGSSYCNAQSSPDFYGKMSFHWTSNGTPANEQLKTYLDPANTGTLVLFGSADPCSAPQAPVANFSANQTTVSPGTTVNFTDLSSGVPTSWAWSISPATGWAFAGGTTASTQNPQITFNTVGQYTITLTATNAIGSDQEIKTNYIIVSVATTPCAGTSSNCDEYISNVTLNTINNTSACTNYGNYVGTSTTLNKGAQYTATVMPTITGQGNGAYNNDEIAIWIDWNDDLDFADAGEQVGYVLVGTGWSNQFTFTVPMTATVGTVTMRVRLSYQPDDGTIAACGTSQWGEVEDYSIVVQNAPSGVLTLQCGGTQTVYASQSTVVPNVTSTATSSTTCPGGAVNETQSPAAGTPLANGANTITVTATDQCGNTQTCTTVVNYVNNLGVEEINQFSYVSLFPNPVSEELSVDLSTLIDEKVAVELYDMSGKLLVKTDNTSKAIVTIDMSSFANGMYQLKLMSDKAQIMKRVSKM